MSHDYDLVVIGAGMAGVAAAQKCASAGWDVAIVDALPYGGTCALRGCDPKKILRRGAEVVEGARLMRGKGIDEAGLSINWADLVRHKHGFTDHVPAQLEAGLSDSGVETLHGTARFIDPQTIAIGDTTRTARHFLVATGARPRPLGFPGHEHLIDSTAFLDLPALPPRILFVGGGFISFEFAHIAARAGANPVVVDRRQRPLSAFDPDLVDLLIDRGTQSGVQTWRCATVAAVARTSTGYEVSIVDEAGESRSAEFDLVVHGAGRTPELATLGLDAAGVDWDERGVGVAGHLQSTTNPGVYAAGDAAATAGLPLTPVAVFEGKVAASNLLKGTTTVPDYTGVPTTVFTIPELTRVGLLETEAHEQGIDVDVRYTDTSSWYSNYRIGESTAATKILIDRSRDTIVGAHLLGPDYAHLVNVFGMAMKLGLTTRQLKSATAAYPTAESDLGHML